MVASILRRGARRVLAAAMAAALLGPVAAFPEDALPAGNAPVMAEAPAETAPAPQAQSLSEPEAAHAPGFEAGQVFRDCPHCPEMVVVPAGTYDGRDDWGQVTFAFPFAAGVHEVTRGEFGHFVFATGHSTEDSCEILESGKWKDQDRSGRSWRNPGFSQTDSHPAVCVNWYDAQAYVGWLSRETGESYRLLSESEWEYAARAGTPTSRYWGDSSSGQCRYVNGADASSGLDGGMDCDDGYSRTSPVGSFGANGFGLHDVLGNVQEWVQDCATNRSGEVPIDGSPWVRMFCFSHVIRGGSWLNSPKNLRAPNRWRNGFSPSLRSDTNGFRVARTLVHVNRLRRDPFRDVRRLGGRMYCWLERYGDLNLDWDDALEPILSTVRGDFLGDGREIGLALWNSQMGCQIGREDGEGGSATLDSHGSSAFAGVCHDRVSGRDHVIVHDSDGQHGFVSVWSLGAETAPPKMLYSEYWVEYGGELVAPDGACRWRDLQRAGDAYTAAMAALRIDRDASWIEDEEAVVGDGRGEGPWPWRAVAAETARDHLQGLRGVATRFEGAVYADEDAGKSWFVVQVLARGRTNCDLGVVLLLNRETGQWKTIYDVPSGCSKSSHIPMRGMVVADDRLYAGVCTASCDGWGGFYADFEIDLRTNRAARLDEGAEAPGPSEEENPELDDPVAAAFAE